MVSIAAFQAVDPGSIPGHRRNLLSLFATTFFSIYEDEEAPQEYHKILFVKLTLNFNKGWWYNGPRLRVRFTVIVTCFVKFQIITNIVLLWRIVLNVSENSVRSEPTVINIFWKISILSPTMRKWIIRYLLVYVILRESFGCTKKVSFIALVLKSISQVA